MTRKSKIALVFGLLFNYSDCLSEQLEQQKLSSHQLFKDSSQVVIPKKSHYLDNEIKEMTFSSFPSCNTQDYFWSEKYGTDFVALPSIDVTDAYITADYITGQQNGVHYASGNVVGYKNDKTIVADWLFYNQKSSHAIGGDIILSKRYDVVRGKWIDYYIDLDRGVVLDAILTNSKTDMIASGKEIDIINKDKYLVKNGYFTTCDPNNPAWNIRSESTSFNYQDSQGVARNAVFYVKSVPIMGFPYLIFPLGNRHSGILTPEMGVINGTSYLGEPYYWNMAPNYDMTITPKFYTTYGFMLVDQFRYLNESGNGEVYTEQMPSQTNTNNYRYYWHLFDNHHIIPELTVGYKYNQVSDNNYFVDFGNFYSSVDNLNLEKSADIKYTQDWYSLEIKAQYYQTLQPAELNQSLPIYASLPQVNFNVGALPIGDSGFNFGLIAQYTNFTINNDALQTGQRTVFYPNINYLYQNKYSFINPKIGYNFTNYNLNPFGEIKKNNIIERGAPISSIDSGLIFERPVSLLRSGYLQTLEPRIYYLYIPSINQGGLPMFDTAQSSANISQLFSENRFSGFDRINQANDLTFGLNSKLINENNGFEFANWGIGYRYYLEQKNDFIYGDKNRFNQLYLPQPNLITEVSNKWLNDIITTTNFQYDTVYGQIDGYNLQFQYKDENFRVLNARFGYQYKQPLIYYQQLANQQYTQISFVDQYAIDLSGQLPIFSNKWLLEGRTNYDFTQKQILNILAGLEYNGGCWSVRGIYQNYIGTNTANPINPKHFDAWYLEFNLRGLTSFGYGGNPTSNLNINVPGYIPITDIR